MSISLRFGLGAALVAVVSVGVWVRQTLDERLRDFQTRADRYASASPASSWPTGGVGQVAGGMGGMGWAFEEAPDPAALASRATPLTPAAARTWAALLRPVDLPFAEEIALEDALKYCRTATRAEGLLDGVAFYADPIGLQEAEQTLSSPVAIDVQGLPLASGLELMLRQLDLGYQVDADGLVRVEYRHDRGAAPIKGRPVLIGSEDLATLMAQAAAYRASKGAPIGSADDGSPSGGFCGTFAAGGFR